MGFIIECNTLVAGTVGFFFLQGKMFVKRASWPLSAKLYLEFTEILVSPHLNPQKISKNKLCLDFIDEDCFHTRTRGKRWLYELPKAYLRGQYHPILILTNYSAPSRTFYYNFFTHFFTTTFLVVVSFLDVLGADLSSAHWPRHWTCLHGRDSLSWLT